MRYFRLLVPAVLVLLGAVALAAREQDQPVRVLFVGNSYVYVNDLPKMIEELAIAGKQRRFHHESEAPGGCTLEKHWKDGKAVAKITRGGWDYVVLQEQSTRPLTDRHLMFEFAAKLDGEVRKQSARTLLYQTWARQDAPETQAALSQAYLDLARELTAGVAPVGTAWERALKEDPALVLHDQDKSHPAQAGTYLAACVFYGVIYGRSPEGLPGAIGGLGDDAARKLQRVAWKIVQLGTAR